MIHMKRTLSDCVIDGRIPEAVRLDEQSLLRQSRQALSQWIERVKNKD